MQFNESISIINKNPYLDNVCINSFTSVVCQNKFVFSFAILVTFFILSRLAVFIFAKIILRITSKTKTKIDDEIVTRTSKPISIILLLIGCWLALIPLGLPQFITSFIAEIFHSLIIVAVTYITIVVFDILIDEWGQKIASKTESTLDDQLIPVFHRISRIFIAVIGLLFVLMAWGVQIGPFLASLGVAGIAVAFALQNTLANIFGGASIILDKSVKVGDKIKLDADTMGTVVDVGLRSTKIKTWDNELVTMPNGKLADMKILNFKQPDPIRTSVEFGVAYGTETKKVRETVLETLSRVENVLKEPAPEVQMASMGDFSLNFRVLYFVPDFDVKYRTKAAVVEQIYNDLQKAGIVIPFPTRTVYLKKEE
ncbi:MAG TPA: mechanosensitive ion channel family protein [Candidatus Nanoarchaeia archaeon]|nr:mechanosensitive ion channel family protein [Candidatus Nanoarchaeia archaeon]